LLFLRFLGFANVLKTLYIEFVLRTGPAKLHPVVAASVPAEFVFHEA